MNGQSCSTMALLNDHWARFTSSFIKPVLVIIVPRYLYWWTTSMFWLSNSNWEPSCLPNCITFVFSKLINISWSFYFWVKTSRSFLRPLEVGQYITTSSAYACILIFCMREGYSMSSKYIGNDSDDRMPPCRTSLETLQLLDLDPLNSTIV